VNGGTRRSSAAGAAKKQGLAFFSIIVFNNSFKVFSDPNGRFLICDIVADNKRLTVANIYALNEDDPNFFQDFLDHLSNFKCGEIIIDGDFNLVLDIEKDKKGGLARTHKNAFKVIRDFSENLGLTDVWRLLNPEARRYSLAPKPTSHTLPTRFFF